MPIYMDRHDVSETVTAEHVAKLHQEDLKIQDQFGCRGLTYWFDDKRKTAFCLVEAPDLKAIEKMHNKAHGEVPHSIIEVNASIVESFLGRIGDPEKAQNTELNIINDPAFRTLMVISLHRETLPPFGTDPLISPKKKFLPDLLIVLKMYGGNLVRETATCFLISFKSVSYAVHASLDIHQLFTTFNNNKHEPFDFKIGLSAGIPVTEKQSIFEDTIKLAERMCAMVKGKIIVSPEVGELYDSENHTPVSKLPHISVLTKSDENFITGLADFMESAWSQAGLKVTDYCRPLGYSKSRLYRKMMMLMGIAPRNFISEFRLKKALDLLLTNNYNISEIAYNTGFTSPSYFSKCFHKRFRRLPSEYVPGKN